MRSAWVGTWSRRMLSSVMASVLMVSGVGAIGQDNVGTKPAEKSAVAKEPAKDGKDRSKSRGRLPAYFAEVVTPDQKEKIYAIQEQYADQLKKLQAEIETLQQKRVAEIEGVLSAEQKEKVAELTAKGRVGRKSEKPAANVETP